LTLEDCAHLRAILVATTAAADWIDETGKAVEEEEEWSWADFLLHPVLIAVYVVVAIIAIVSSILMWRSARR